MKTFIISLVILAIILTGGVFYTSALDDISAQMVSQTDAIYESLQAEDFQTAKQQTGQLKETWEENKKVLTALIDHSYLSAIDISVAELVENVNYEEVSQASEKNAKIKTQMEDIAQNEHLYFENIL